MVRHGFQFDDSAFTFCGDLPGNLCEPATSSVMTGRRYFGHQTTWQARRYTTLLSDLM